MPDRQSIVLYTYYAIIASWIIFGSLFLLRKRQAQGVERKRDSRAFTGVLIEGLGYAIIWSFRRKQPEFINWGGDGMVLFLSTTAVLLAFASNLLASSAIRTLGRQWAVAARVVENHELVTSGPYSIVRNPIYSGMLGMLIATGLAVSVWWAVPVAVAVFWYGTTIRVRIEEDLLRQTFGDDFDKYCKQVPAMIPKIF